MAKEILIPQQITDEEITVAYSPEGVVSAFISFDAETNTFNYSES